MSTSIRSIRGVHHHEKDQRKPFRVMTDNGKSARTEFAFNKADALTLALANNPEVQNLEVRGPNAMRPKLGRRVKRAHLDD